MKLTGDRCQCTVCGEYFNSTHAFEKHRYGPYEDRSCMSPEEMLSKGWGKNSKGFWVTALFKDIKNILKRKDDDSTNADY